MNRSLRVKAWILFQINKHTNAFYLQFTINVFQTYFLTSVNDAAFYDLQNFCKTCIAIHFRYTFFCVPYYCLCWRWSPTCQIFMDPRYPTIHAKIFTHAIFWTHVKILWTQATHATLAKIWLMPPTPPPLFSRLFWSLSRLHSNSFFPLLLITALLIKSWSFVPQNLPLQSFCSLSKRLCLSRWP